jgi:hypothetical protein
MANTTGKKFGGRKKGTPNRLTKELRAVLKGVVFNELESLEENLTLLDPKERIELVIRLMPYAVPRVRDIGHDLNEPLDWGVI